MRVIFWLPLLMAGLLLGTEIGYSQEGQPQALPQPGLFTSEEGGFSVKFPTAPKLSSKKGGTLGVETTRFQFVSEPSKSAYFEVTYIDFPALNDTQASLDGALDGVSRSILAQGGKVLTRTKVTNATCVGRELTGIQPDCKSFKMRFWLSGKRFYNLLVCLANPTPKQEQTAQEFFDSFRFFGGCKNQMTAVEGPSSEVITKKLEGTPDPKTGWRLIQSERDRFSVLMPSAVSLKEEEVRREPLQLFRYFYSSEKDECVVMVLRGFEKIGLGSQLTLQVLLDVMEREVKQEFEKKQSTMTLVKNLQIGNYPGREYQVVLPNGLSRIRMFATPDAHYTIMVTKPNKEDLETLAEPFFRSFSLNGTTQ